MLNELHKISYFELLSFAKGREYKKFGVFARFSYDVTYRLKSIYISHGTTFSLTYSYNESILHNNRFVMQ